MKGITRAWAGQRNNRGCDQEAPVPIDRDRRSTAHRDSREWANLSKQKVTKVASSSYWHRRPPDLFGSLEMASENSRMECWSGDREIAEARVVLVCELPYFTGQSEAAAKR
jgi:hypothetical protein